MARGVGLARATVLRYRLRGGLIRLGDGYGHILLGDRALVSVGSRGTFHPSRGRESRAGAFKSLWLTVQSATALRGLKQKHSNLSISVHIHAIWKGLLVSARQR